MITCDTFRRTFTAGTEDADVLEHLRSCDACLAVAIEGDPDVLFRSIGGEMLPPGGVDAFVSDVMREVHLRSTETRLEPRRMGLARRFAIAATFAAATLATLLYYRTDHPAAVPQAVAPVTRMAALTTKPVIESYESSNATIVEVPAESSSDIAVVMVFDESLPADL